MILEYCNSDIYFDIYIYHLKEKKKHERFSLVVVFFFSLSDILCYHYRNV